MKRKTLFQINNFKFQKQLNFYSNLKIQENSTYLFIHQKTDLLPKSIFSLKKEHNFNIYTNSNNKMLKIENLKETDIPYFSYSKESPYKENNFVLNTLLDKAFKNYEVNKSTINYFKDRFRKNYLDILVQITELTNTKTRILRQKVNEFFYYYIQQYKKVLPTDIEAVSHFYKNFIEDWNDFSKEIFAEKIHLLTNLLNCFTNSFSKSSNINIKKLENEIQSNQEAIKIIKTVIDNPNLSYDNLVKARSLKDEKIELSKNFIKNKKRNWRNFDQLLFYLNNIYQIPKNKNLDISLVLKYRRSIYQIAYKYLKSKKHKLTYVNENEFKQFINLVFEQIYFTAVSESSYNAWKKNKRVIKISLTETLAETLHNFQNIGKRNRQEYNEKLIVISKEIKKNTEMVSWQQNNSEITELLTTKYYTYDDAVIDKNWFEKHKKDNDDRRSKLNIYLISKFRKDERKSKRNNLKFINKILKQLNYYDVTIFNEYSKQLELIIEEDKKYNYVEKLLKFVGKMFNMRFYNHQKRIKKFYTLYMFFQNTELFKISPDILAKRYKSIGEFNANKLQLLESVLFNKRLVEIDFSSINIKSPFGSWIFKSLDSVLKLNSLSCVGHLLNSDDKILSKIELIKYDHLLLTNKLFITLVEKNQQMQNVSFLLKLYENIKLTDYVNIAKIFEYKIDNISNLDSILRRYSDHNKRKLNDTRNFELTRYIHK